MLCYKIVMCEWYVDVDIVDSPEHVILSLLKIYCSYSRRMYVVLLNNDGHGVTGCSAGL